MSSQCGQGLLTMDCTYESLPIWLSETCKLPLCMMETKGGCLRCVEVEVQTRISTCSRLWAKMVQRHAI